MGKPKRVLVFDDFQDLVSKAEVPDRWDRVVYAKGASGHHMVVTGVHVDEDGDLILEVQE